MSIRPPQADVNQGFVRTSQVSARPDATRGSSPGSGADAVPDDTVTLTTAAAQLVRLEESLAAVPDIDSTRVTAIKAAIAQGSYRVDPEKIVQRLLGLENDIFQ